MPIKPTTPPPTQVTVDESAMVSHNQPAANPGDQVMAPVLRPVDTIQKGSMPSLKIAIPMFLLAVVLGVGTGFGVFKLRAQTASSQAGPEPMSQVATGAVKVGDVFGIKDESTFKDMAEGYLEIGGMDGEGSHKLLRPGGDSQTVYLTSSVTSLDDFDGMQVKIWGETFKGQKAGWLMDVGRVEVVATKADKPE